MRRPFSHFCQELLHLWIGKAVVGIRIFLLLPQADFNRFRTTGGDERDFILEAFLFSKQGDDFLLDRPGKLPTLLGFRCRGNISRQTSLRPPWFRLRGTIFR